MTANNILKVKSEYFNVDDTLKCGQVFRYSPYDKGYIVISANKACYVYQENGETCIESKHLSYFENYFDLSRDYSQIVSDISKFNCEYITNACQSAKGIRILKQNLIETSFSFIISQNNNIKRIQKTIEFLCEKLGEPFYFKGQLLHAFPSPDAIFKASDELLKSCGLGYRFEYIKDFAKRLLSGYDLTGFSALKTDELVVELKSNKGIGKKVADCIALFGYGKTDSFPVDTWIEKVYRENLGGTLLDRKKISAELSGKFKDLSGFVQQYVFHYKRKNG